MFTKTNKKLIAVLTVVLLLPLLAIGYFAFRLATGTTEFDAVDRARLVLPDKTEYVYEDKSDISYFTSLLSRSSVISTAVRDISEETPASLYLNDTKYDIYASRSVS